MISAEYVGEVAAQARMVEASRVITNAGRQRPAWQRQTQPPVGASRTDLETAHRVLESLGVSPRELLESPDLPPVPTFAQYVPVVSDAVSPGTRRVYCYVFTGVIVCSGAVSSTSC
ncbi:hypothetical protein [Kibdelosporangium philippinense]|uniref:hypothetical protein n=1 Tax=Kibdelosporangium philippinense TaxID=211113 RepID=UPI00360913D3